MSTVVNTLWIWFSIVTKVRKLTPRISVKSYFRVWLQADFGLSSICSCHINARTFQGFEMIDCDELLSVLISLSKLLLFLFYYHFYLIRLLPDKPAIILRIFVFTLNFLTWKISNHCFFHASTEDFSLWNFMCLGGIK